MKQQCFVPKEINELEWRLSTKFYKKTIPVIEPKEKKKEKIPVKEKYGSLKKEEQQ